MCFLLGGVKRKTPAIHDALEPTFSKPTFVFLLKKAWKFERFQQISNRIHGPHGPRKNLSIKKRSIACNLGVFGVRWDSVPFNFWWKDDRHCNMQWSDPEQMSAWWTDDVPDFISGWWLQFSMWIFREVPTTFTTPFLKMLQWPISNFRGGDGKSNTAAPHQNPPGPTSLLDLFSWWYFTLYHGIHHHFFTTNLGEFSFSHPPLASRKFQVSWGPSFLPSQRFIREVKILRVWTWIKKLWTSRTRRVGVSSGVFWMMGWWDDGMGWGRSGWR